MVIEVDVIFNQETSLVDRLWFVPPNTLRLQYTEEVFCHCIIIGANLSTFVHVLFKINTSCYSYPTTGGFFSQCPFFGVQFTSGGFLIYDIASLRAPAVLKCSLTTGRYLSMHAFDFLNKQIGQINYFFWIAL